MILTDALWPLFAISSLLGATPQDRESPQDSLKFRFPGHTLYQLNDGNVIPSPAWGTGTATARTGNATELVGQALAAGWRHIDTSLNYRNQNGTGEAIKASGIPRKDLYVTSKYDAFTNTSLTEELHQTLSELQLDYLDLYLIHFPRAAKNGGGLKKIWKQMERAKQDGLVKSIGVSNYDTPELIQELLDVAEILPCIGFASLYRAVNQIQFSVYDTFEVAPAFALGAKHGMLFSAYGELSPITRNPGGPADIVGHQIAKRLSQDVGHQVTYAQVIFDWLRSTGVIAVTTTSNKDRLKEQLIPFADGFPLITAAEARAFELSGLGWQSRLSQA